jgi:tRNA1(Val) A37 N6-methylase TrmN6
MLECVCSSIPECHWTICLPKGRLELGAGGGLVGLAVAIGCDVHHPIYITDQENMVDLMVKNIALNGLDSRVKPLVLNWWVVFPA